MEENEEITKMHQGNITKGLTPLWDFECLHILVAVEHPGRHLKYGASVDAD